MVLPPKLLHPEGEANLPEKKPVSKAIEVETFAGKTHVEWDPAAIGVRPMLTNTLTSVAAIASDRA